MIKRAYILIKLIDGTSVNYVNTIVQDTLGKNGLYYSYTGNDGDKLENQIGAGKVLGDFETLVSQIGETGLVTWPEGGTVLERKNNDQSLKNESVKRFVLTKKSIASIEIIETEVNEFEQLEYERSVH